MDLCRANLLRPIASVGGVRAQKIWPAPLGARAPARAAHVNKSPTLHQPSPAMPPFDDFESVRTDMTLFSSQFAGAISKTRMAVIQTKQEFEVQITSLISQQHQLEADIASLRLKERKIKDSIDKSLQNIQMQQFKVSDLQRKHADLQATRDTVQAQIDSLNHQISQVQQSLQDAKLNLSRQQQIDYPEMVRYEQYLGMRIEAALVDVLRFIFFNVDAEDVDREVWCELLVAGELYRLGQALPDLAAKEQIENEFNEHKEFVRFLKRVRTALQQALKSAARTNSQEGPEEEIREDKGQEDHEAPTKDKDSKNDAEEPMVIDE